MNKKILLCSVKLFQLCPTLCDPMNCSLPGSSGRRIIQAKILEWVAMPSSRRSSQPRDQTQVSCICHLSHQGILLGQILKLIRTRNSFLCLFHFLPSRIGMPITIIICLSYRCILEAGALLMSCFTDSQMRRNFAPGF